MIPRTSPGSLLASPVSNQAKAGPKASILLLRIPLGICEILPRVDVRAVYDMYYRPFLLWAIIAGLMLKFVYLRSVIRWAWSKCAVVDLTMNAASSLLNLIAVPLAFLVWTPPRLAINRALATADSDPVNWFALLLIMAMMSTLSEAFVLRFVFKQRLGQKKFWLLYVANAVCMGFAAYGMSSYEGAHPPTA